MKPEIRRDYIQERYVIIAPQRSKRPVTERPEYVDPIPKKSSCYFCPKNLKGEEVVALFGPGNPWQIAVLENKFPAVSLDNSQAYGKQEVVVETPDHNIQLEELHEEQIAQLLSVYAVRTEVLSQIPNIEYILIFKNSGGKAGASVHHSHSQIFATKLLPPHLLDKSQRMQEYKLKNGKCVYCDVINQERHGKRLIYEDDNVIAFAPYASMHNYEVWILPKRHFDNITEINANEKLSWAFILKRVLRAIVKLKLPYNFYFHQLLNDDNQHLYMKITPRGSVWAGLEIGSGLIINPVSPEDAAEYYRKHLS